MAENFESEKPTAHHAAAEQAGMRMSAEATDALFAKAEPSRIASSKNDDGSTSFRSSGPRSEDNFEGQMSADGRSFSVKYKDGKQVSLNYDEQGNLLSGKGTGSRAEDNFSVDSRGRIKHDGPAFDPLKLAARFTFDRAQAAVKRMRQST